MNQHYLVRAANYFSGGREWEDINHDVFSSRDIGYLIKEGYLDPTTGEYTPTDKLFDELDHDVVLHKGRTGLDLDDAYFDFESSKWEPDWFSYGEDLVAIEEELDGDGFVDWIKRKK